MNIEENGSDDPLTVEGDPDLGLIDGQARACELALAFLDGDSTRFAAILVEAEADGAVLDVFTAIVGYWAPLLVSNRGEASVRMLLKDTGAAARRCLQEGLGGEANGGL